MALKPMTLNDLEGHFLPRDAMLARYMLSSCVCPSVSLSVRLSDTSRHSIPKWPNVGSRNYARDSSFLTPKISAKFQRGHPQRGCQIEVG